jgi:hypothetical protein
MALIHSSLSRSTTTIIVLTLPTIKAGDADDTAPSRDTLTLLHDPFTTLAVAHTLPWLTHTIINGVICVDVNVTPAGVTLADGDDDREALTLTLCDRVPVTLPVELADARSEGDVEPVMLNDPLILTLPLTLTVIDIDPLLVTDLVTDTLVVTDVDGVTETDTDTVTLPLHVVLSVAVPLPDVDCDTDGDTDTLEDVLTDALGVVEGVCEIVGVAVPLDVAVAECVLDADVLGDRATVDVALAVAVLLFDDVKDSVDVAVGDKDADMDELCDLVTERVLVAVFVWEDVTETVGVALCVAVLVVDEDKEVVGDTVDDAEGDILDVVECDWELPTLPDTVLVAVMDEVEDNETLGDGVVENVGVRE